MPGREEGAIERDRWLSYLERSKNLVAKKVRYCVYEINGRKTNIKFANRRTDDTFWFNVSPNYLNEIDVFVWLCESWEDYYVIPNDKMNRLIETGNYLSKASGYPSFLLRPSDHKYLPTKADIETFYRDLSPLL
jgi:hypothetical protein